MSVSAIITHPQNKYEETFSIPIATQSFFNKYWIKAIEETQGELITGFMYGIDISKKDIPELLRQLFQVKEWVNKNIFGEDSEHMLKRINLLIEQLPLAFNRYDAIVFIG